MGEAADAATTCLMRPETIHVGCQQGAGQHGRAEKRCNISPGATQRAGHGREKPALRGKNCRVGFKRLDQSQGQELRADPMLLGCIADDFTGASDLANTLAKGGMATMQFVGIPDGPAPAGCEAGVVALKSRTIPVADAVAQSLAACEWLLAQGATQILFKYCSTFDSKFPSAPTSAASAALLQPPRAALRGAGIPSRPMSR